MLFTRANVRSSRLAHPARSCRGVTLVEIIAVLGILLVLGMLIFGVASRLPGKADQVRCINNLRQLHAAFSKSLDDNEGVWPREPAFNLRSQRAQFEDWWIREMKPYGATEDIWQCPGLRRLGKITASGETPRMSYLPTKFDQKPNTARMQTKTPWLVEIGNIHGHGPLCVLSDGSVHDWDFYIARVTGGSAAPPSGN